MVVHQFYGQTGNKTYHTVAARPLRRMSQTTQSQQTRSAQFTISEQETDSPSQAVIARTKRYAFYWLLGEEPILLLVRDYDGSDVTEKVTPPEEMYDRLAQSSQSAA